MKTIKKQAAQVYFPIEEYILIKNDARRLGISIAEFIRRGTKKYQKEVVPKKKKINVSDLPTFTWEGDYPTDLAQNHDEYLYGEKSV